MATGQKGTKSNPYTMAEYESMANAGTWEGGFVMDDSGEAVYMMREVTVKGSGSDSGSEHGSSLGSQFEFSDGSYTPHTPEDDDDDDDDDDEGTIWETKVGTMVVAGIKEETQEMLEQPLLAHSTNMLNTTRKLRWRPCIRQAHGEEEMCIH